MFTDTVPFRYLEVGSQALTPGWIFSTAGLRTTETTESEGAGQYSGPESGCWYPTKNSLPTGLSAWFEQQRARGTGASQKETPNFPARAALLAEHLHDALRGPCTGPTPCNIVAAALHTLATSTIGNATLSRDRVQGMLLALLQLNIVLTVFLLSNSSSCSFSR